MKTKSISSAGIVDGMQLYINDKEAKVPVAVPVVLVPVKPSEGSWQKGYIYVDKKEEVKKDPKKWPKKEEKKADPKVEAQKSAEWKKSLCNHGPGGHCLNCSAVTDEEVRGQVYEEKCDHPPHGKCPKCLNRGFIKDVATVKRKLE